MHGGGRTTAGVRAFRLRYIFITNNELDLLVFILVKIFFI